MEAAGYRLLNDYDLIDHQHFQIFAKADHPEEASPPPSGSPLNP
jgi:hypothetical protein